MEMRIVVLYASAYRIINDSTGELENSGLTIFAYEKPDFKPCEKLKGGNIVKGRRPLKFNCPEELGSKIVQVPGVYDVEIEMEANNQLKGVISVVDLEFYGLLDAKVIPHSAQPAK